MAVRRKWAKAAGAAEVQFKNADGTNWTVGAGGAVAISLSITNLLGQAVTCGGVFVRPSTPNAGQPDLYFYPPNVTVVQGGGDSPVDKLGLEQGDKVFTSGNTAGAFDMILTVNE